MGKGWTSEHWRPGKSDVIDENGVCIVHDEVDDWWIEPEKADRIVACVNACAHLPNEYLEWLVANDRFLNGESLKSVGASMMKFEELTKPAEIKGATEDITTQMVASMNQRLWDIEYRDATQTGECQNGY